MTKRLFIILSLFLIILSGCAMSSKEDERLGKWYVHEMYKTTYTDEQKEESIAQIELLKVLGMDMMVDVKEDNTGTIYFYQQGQDAADVAILTFEPSKDRVTIEQSDEGEIKKSIGKYTIKDGALWFEYDESVLVMKKEPLQISETSEDIINQILTDPIFDEEGSNGED